MQVIIDSQPLTVAVLASILFGETIGALGVLGLATGVIGLLLLEVLSFHLEYDVVNNIWYTKFLSFGIFCNVRSLGNENTAFKSVML